MATPAKKKVELDRQEAAFDPLMRPGTVFVTKSVEVKTAPRALPVAAVASSTTTSAGESASGGFLSERAPTSKGLFGDDDDTGRGGSASGALFGEPDSAPITRPTITPTPATAVASPAKPAAAAAAAPVAKATPTPTPVPAATPAAAPAPAPTPAVSQPVEEPEVDMFGSSDDTPHQSFASLSLGASQQAAPAPVAAPKQAAPVAAKPAEAALFSDEGADASQHNLDGLFIPKGAAQTRTDKDKAKFQELEDDLLTAGDDDLDRFSKPRAAAPAAASAPRPAASEKKEEPLDDDLFSITPSKPSASAAVSAAPAQFDFAAYISSAKDDDSSAGGLFS